MSKTKTTKTTDYRELRRKLNLSQHEFWHRVGVTQSGGSRYESGRAIPKPVIALLDMTYGKTPLKTLAKLRGESVQQIMAAGK